MGIEAIKGVKSLSKSLSLINNDEKTKEKTAYAGPSIGNLLNGSANPPTQTSFQG